MERKIDRAVDHDGGIGTNPLVPDVTLTPPAKARGTAVRAIASQRLFWPRAATTGRSPSGVKRKLTQASSTGKRAPGQALSTQRDG